MESYMTKDDDIIQSLIKQLALKPSDGDSIEALCRQIVALTPYYHRSLNQFSIAYCRRDKKLSDILSVS
ncbi:hypothetical protein [Oligella sp. HMSC09E12]|uniref:hypothetical protein n=1 Tax=Oligella sp. HMSC09E12 TaxID=1581147 RepID=UPI0008A40875|nr:hypothetical protein [Oligella sp. HMSC09E12]OFV50853.1 hypothetical protein HMPREF3179_01880 [Oligella sp. HMSC09E12]